MPWVRALFLAIPLAGCGGSGNPQATAAAIQVGLKGHLEIANGTSVRDYAPSATPQDIELTVAGLPITEHSVIVATPLAATDPVLVLLPGTQILNGNYISSSMRVDDTFDNLTTNVPIDSQGNLTESVAIFNSSGTITLPIDAIGPFRFPNGIRFTPDIGASTAAGTVDFMSNLSIDQAGDVAGSASETLSKATTLGTVLVSFGGDSSAGSLVIRSGLEPSPVAATVTGSRGKKDFVFTTAKLSYTCIDP